MLLGKSIELFPESANLYLSLAAVFVTLLVALIAVSVQSLRAARANPIEALRHE